LFVTTNKNDARDAEAIAEAAQRPSMRFVAVKTLEQQDVCRGQSETGRNLTI
jgi:transposase